MLLSRAISTLQRHLRLAFSSYATPAFISGPALKQPFRLLNNAVYLHITPPPLDTLLPQVSITPIYFYMRMPRA